MGAQHLLRGAGRVGVSVMGLNRNLVLGTRC